MKINLNVFSLIVIALISQGLLASIILLIKRENKTANRYLSLLTFLLSLWLSDTFFRVAGIYSQNPNFYFLPIYFSLGFGPLIYFYTLQLTGHHQKLNFRTALNFAPVLLQFLFYLFLQSNDYSYRRDFWLHVHQPITYELELVSSFLSLLIYLWLSRQIIKTHKMQIENSFSDTDRLTLKWLNQLHFLLFVLSIFWLFESSGRLIWNFYPPTPISAITVGFVIIFIAIGGIVQIDLSEVSQALSDQHGQEDLVKQSLPIDPTEVERIKQILIYKELYLIPDITLKEFSEHVKLSPRETSHLINKGLEMTFIDFINQYRILRFKELVSNSDMSHYSLLGLAYKSGFNSKSTFNRVFKKMEGKSPSSYLDKS